MASVGAKKRAKHEARKAGRPRKEGVPRYPSGKVNTTRMADMTAAMDVRRKLCALIGLTPTEDELRADMCGMAFGRVAMTAPKDQRREVFEAGCRMWELRRRYLGTNDQREAWANENRPAPTGVLDDDDGDRQRKEATRLAYDTARAVARAADPLGDMVLQGVIFEDRDMPTYTGETLVVLNALAHHFSVGRHNKKGVGARSHPYLESAG